MSTPLRPETQAILAAINGYGSDSHEIAAQAFRALALLACAPTPIDRGQLIRIAEELDP
jgi:hypothetical protein